MAYVIAVMYWGFVGALLCGPVVHLLKRSRRVRRAWLVVLGWVCTYHGHRDRLVTSDLGPLGTWAWWYCDRCTWSSPMRYLGPSLRMQVARMRQVARYDMLSRYPYELTTRHPGKGEA